MLAVAAGYVTLSPELHELTDPHTLPAGGAGEVGRLRGIGYSTPTDLVRSLSDREYEVLLLLARGVTTAEAAATLNVTRATIKSHVSHALTKLGVRSRLEAVLVVHQSMQERADLAPIE